MDLRTRIQTLFKEAEIYRQQGLNLEAKQNYESVVGLLEQNPNIKNREQLLSAIARKIKAVEAEMKVEEEDLPPEQIPSQMQDLVKGFFPAAEKKKDSGASAFKGAVALAQLRQYDRALIEFRKLLPQDNLRPASAKNILKCHLALFSLESAVTEYEEWMRGDTFSDDQIEGVRVFFEELLKKRGIPRELVKRHADAAPAVQEAPAQAPAPAPVPASSSPESDDTLDPDTTALKIAPSAAALEAEAQAAEAAEEEPIEICSIEITPEAGPKKGIPIEFDVTAQTGNRLHITVPSKDEEYIQAVDVGQTLSDLQFFSHFVMFRGTGKVLSKRKIESGNRKGDFNLSIRMEAPGD